MPIYTGKKVQHKEDMDSIIMVNVSKNLIFFLW